MACCVPAARSLSHSEELFICSFSHSLEFLEGRKGGTSCLVAGVRSLVPIGKKGRHHDEALPSTITQPPSPGAALVSIVGDQSKPRACV